MTVTRLEAALAAETARAEVRREIIDRLIARVAELEAALAEHQHAADA